MKLSKKLLYPLIITSVIIVAYSINAKLIQNRSIKAQFFTDVLKLMDGKKMGPSQFSSLEIAQEFMNEKVAGSKVKYSLMKDATDKSFIKDSFGETDVYRFFTKEVTKKKLIYIHGGGFVNEILNEHINFALEIGEAIDAEVILPISPLTPYANAKQVHHEMMMMYKKISETWTDEKIILMGESSGGGFALSLAQQIKMDSLYPTNQLVLMSPWVEVSMDNPLITEDLETRDHMIEAKALALLGKYWKGDLDVKNPIISPTYGDLNQLGHYTIIAGTEEVLLPDIKDLVTKLEKQNISHEYYEYKNMMHAFPLFELPESLDAMDIIINTLENIDSKEN